MDTTLFLAQVMGLYLAIMGLSILLRREMWEKVVSEFFDSSSRIYTTGVFILIIGLLLVLSHNVWEGGLKIVVTVLGWAVFAKGLAYVFLPHSLLKDMARGLNGKNVYVTGGVVALIFGLYLAGKGFLLL